MVIGRKGFAGRKMPAESAFRAFVFSAHRDGLAAVSKDFGHARIYPSCVCGATSVSGAKTTPARLAPRHALRVYSLKFDDAETERVDVDGESVFDRAAFHLAVDHPLAQQAGKIPNPIAAR